MCLMISIPSTNMKVGESWLQKVVLLPPHRHCGVCRAPFICVHHMHTNNVIINKNYIWRVYIVEKKQLSSYSMTKVTSAYKITSTTIHLWFLERGQGLIQHAFYFCLSIPNDHLPVWGKAEAKTCLLMNSKIINLDSNNYLSLLLSRVPRFWALNKTISSEAVFALEIQTATHTIHSSEKNLHIMQILWLRIDNFPQENYRTNAEKCL